MMKRIAIRYAFLMLLGVALFGWALSAGAEASDAGNAARPAAAEHSQYVGSDTCKSCHEDLFQQFMTTPHGHAGRAHNPSGAEGCESCHGPGKAHVEGGGDVSKIFTFKDASPAQVSERCDGCHRDNHDHQHFARSSHFSNGVSCIGCHSPHHAKQREALLTEKQPELCYSCHETTRDEFEQPFHHRVNEGLVKCADCHNVHGGNVAHQLRTSSVQDSACFKCHAEKRGPFVFEHPPVKTEGCTSCHTPHGSTVPRLLNVAQVNALCLQCHTDIIAGPHPQNTRAQACTYCHTQIHGSNASSVFFK